MRNIFNKFAQLFKNPTKQLHKELNKSFFTVELEDLDLQTSYPSAAKVKELISEGANVNRYIDYSNALSICARQYKDTARIAQPDSGMTITINNHVVTQEEWKAYADRFLEIGKVLIDAGADPRLVEGRVKNNAMWYLTDGDRVPVAQVKDFADMLNAATTALNSRDNAKKSPTP
jgi:hypothetical protein